MDVWASLTALYFGNFKNNGSVWSDDGLGFQISVGVEYNPLSNRDE